jgi:hypothetical protein
MAPGDGGGVPLFGGVALGLSHISENTTSPSAEAGWKPFRARDLKGPEVRCSLQAGTELEGTLGSRRAANWRVPPSSSKGGHLRVERVALHFVGPSTQY